MNQPNKETFFEGKDFNNSPFKALMPEFYPIEYQQYINEETKLLKEKLQGKNKILEAGVGIGRIISEIAPLVSEFIGIDNADRMLNESKIKAEKFPNTKILKGEIEDTNKVSHGAELRGIHDGSSSHRIV